MFLQSHSTYHPDLLFKNILEMFFSFTKNVDVVKPKTQYLGESW